MTNKNLQGIIPESEIGEEEEELISNCNERLSDYMVYFQATEFSKAIEKVLEIVSSTNKYIDDTKPWALAKENKTNELKKVLRTSLEMIRLIAILFYPIIPDSSTKILKALNININKEKSSFNGLNQISSLVENQKIGELDLLFDKIDKNPS